MVSIDHQSLLEIIILLSTAVFIVSIFLKLNISPILGYFATGITIGTHGLKIVKTSAALNMFAEFGIVFLLFLIGLELTLDRLMSMRRHVFGLGTLQVIITAGIIIFICKILGLPLSHSIIIGSAFALSSTAIVLQVLQEQGIQSNQVGRLSIAILLMQDFAVVPLLVFVSLLGDNDPQNLLLPIGISLLKAGIVLAVIFTAGRLLIRPFFKLIASTKSSELFIATSLFIVLGAAYVTEQMELSMAMGAFVAGLLLAETEYRYEVEQVIFPFKSLLLGLFFMNVGMSIDITVLLNNWLLITGISLGLIVIKSVIIIGLARLFGFKLGAAINAGLLLSQSSEFALILLGLEVSHTLLSNDLVNILVSVVTMTMAVTPLLTKIGLSIAARMEKSSDKAVNEEIKADVMDIHNHVIIAGFGRVGRMVAKMLSAEQVNYIIVDTDATVVERAKSEGFPIFKKNISLASTLELMAVNRANAVVLSMQNEVTIKKAIKTISENYPDITIVARVPDYSDYSSYQKLGAHKLIPETYETGLQIGSEVLQSMGFGDYAISSLKERFRAGNYAIPKSITSEDE